MLWMNECVGKRERDTFEDECTCRMAEYGIGINIEAKDVKIWIFKSNRV